MSPATVTPVTSGDLTGSAAPVSRLRAGADLVRWRALELAGAVRHRGEEDPRTAFVDQVLPKGGIGAELGVFKGAFSPVLFEQARPSRLHLVDPWYLLTAEWTWGAGDPSTVHALRRILKRWQRQIDNGSVVVNVGDDRQVLASFDDGYLDWAYVDSSHAYGHTVDELSLLDRKVRPGGVIAGDDWQPDPDHRHHGVYRAVIEFTDTHPYDVIYASNDDHQWALRRNDA
jgi:hypothetical protein